MKVARGKESDTYQPFTVQQGRQRHVPVGHRVLHGQHVFVARPHRIAAAAVEQVLHDGATVALSRHMQATLSLVVGVVRCRHACPGCCVGEDKGARSMTEQVRLCKRFVN